RRAHVEAGGVRAVLADVALHQPAQRLRALVAELDRLLLLDERDVAPRVRVERRGVVVALAGPLLAVLRDEVPFLARDFARLAADAHRRVGEEPHPRLRLVAVGDALVGVRLEERAHVFFASSCSTRGSCSRRESAWSRSSATNCASCGPCGRRPGRMSHVNAFTSWMCTFGSSAMCVRSFAAPPVVSPRVPQWY